MTERETLVVIRDQALEAQRLAFLPELDAKESIRLVTLVNGLRQKSMVESAKYGLVYQDDPLAMDKIRLCVIGLYAAFLTLSAENIPTGESGRAMRIDLGHKLTLVHEQLENTLKEI